MRAYDIIHRVRKASLSAFEADFVQSVDMQSYVLSLQTATTTLENSMPLPPLGEHVAYLQNALVSFFLLGTNM